MSVHRYPCTAELPTIATGSDHTHQCIHDTPHKPLHRLAEHKCACGTTWQASDWTPRPVPDTSWVITEPAENPGSPWVMLAILMVPAAVAAAIVI